MCENAEMRGWRQGRRAVVMLIIGASAMATVSCGMVDDRAASGGSPLPTTSTVAPVGAGPDVAVQGTDPLPTVTSSTTTIVPTPMPDPGPNFIHDLLSVSPTDPSRLSDSGTTLQERIAAKLDREQFYMRARKRREPPTGGLSGDCQTMGQVRQAGFRLALVASSMPDLATYRAAAVGVLDAIDDAAPKLSTIFPGDFVSKAEKAASPGSSTRAALRRATSVDQAVAAFDPIVAQFGVFAAATFAAMDQSCAFWDS